MFPPISRGSEGRTLVSEAALNTQSSQQGAGRGDSDLAGDLPDQTVP